MLPKTWRHSGQGRPCNDQADRQPAWTSSRRQEQAHPRGRDCCACAAEKIGLAVPDAFEGDAHAFLIAIYKDPRQPIELRLEAAGKAIRYEKPARPLWT